MDLHRSIRVTHVQKKAKKCSLSTVTPKVPVINKQKHQDCTQIQSPSSITPWTLSTHAFELPSTSMSTKRLMTNQTHKSKIFLPNSSPSFGVVERSAKKSVKDLRKENKKKKKMIKKIRLIIIALFILCIIAVSIYLAIHFTTKTTSITRPINPMLRWNSIGITIAGIGGSPGLNSSQLRTPHDIAFGLSNTLYITDYLNNRVQYWKIGESSGTTVVGQSNGGSGSNATYLNHPTGLYVDSNENIYVSDSGNNRVQLWNNGASLGTTVAGTGIGGSSNNQLHNAYGIVQDSSTKTLYISDYDNHRVMSYMSGASMGTVVAGGNGPGTSNIQLYNPVGICLDSFTNSLLMANFGAHNIVRWVLGANNWTLVAGNIIGSPGNSSTTLNFPTGVTLDPMGNIYVVDTLNNRIQFFVSDQSEGTTIAGITNINGSNFTQLSTPFTVRLDSQLNLYVVDMGSNRVLKFLRY